MPGREDFLDAIGVTVERAPKIRKEGRGMVGKIVGVDDHVPRGELNDHVFRQEAGLLDKGSPRIVVAVPEPRAGIVRERGFEAITEVEEAMGVGVIELGWSDTSLWGGMVIPATPQMEEVAEIV